MQMSNSLAIAAYTGYGCIIVVWKSQATQFMCPCSLLHGLPGFMENVNCELN